jgi:hypothetical protein
MTTDLSKYRVPRTPLKGCLGNFFSRTSKYRVVRSPHSLQEPGYINLSDANFRHQDSLQRIYEGQFDDRYIDPVDGRVKELVVQCTDRVYLGPRNSTYKRTFIRNVAPITLRVANWPMGHLDDESKRKASKHRVRFLVVVKWPIACYLLNHMVCQAPFNRLPCHCT